MIITVEQGDTLSLISEQYGIPVEKIAADNGIYNGFLVTGQSLYIGIPSKSTIISRSTDTKIISEEFGTSQKQILRNNYILGGKQEIPLGTYLVIDYSNPPDKEKIIGGYAYDFISTERLFSVINYLTYIMPFTYGFTPEGNLIAPNDEYILSASKWYGIKSLLHISTLTDEGYFDSMLPSYIFESNDVQNTLIGNIINTVTDKGYDGVDIDFEYLTLQQKEGYISFIANLSQALHNIGKILVVAVPPMTSRDQRSILVDGIDYLSLGLYADFILIMAYEYGYRFGPPLAISPINQVTRVLDYAVSVIPENKILLGISNYGYDWTLPFIRGESDAPSISTVRAIELAEKYGAEIMFDEVAMAPYFFYIDENGRVHEVWFEDARSFEAKTNLIKQYNLAGGFIWDLMRDNPQGFVTINSAIKIE